MASLLRLAVKMELNLKYLNILNYNSILVKGKERAGTRKYLWRNTNQNFYASFLKIPLESKNKKIERVEE
jgi:hypothetical protein